MNTKTKITRVNHKCVTQHLFQHRHSYPRTVSKAVDIGIQGILELVGELAIVVMAMAEDIVVLKGLRRLTFLEVEDRGGMEVDTIMVGEGVGMVDVVIRGMILVIRRDRCSFDGMVGVAVIVDENLFRALPLGYRYLGCFGGAGTRRDILRCSLDSNRALALALESLMEERSLVQFIKIVLRERSGGVYDEPQWIVGAWM
jgi:hypothetical protein